MPNTQISYSTLASQAILAKTVESLNNKGYLTYVLPTKNEALEKIKTLIPQGASVMNGASTTLDQLGFTDYLKSGQHGWRDLHREISAEPDEAKRHLLRQQSAHAEYYLGSVHALVADGQMVIASNTGSQLPSIVYTSPNLIFVVSTKKIVPTLTDAINRLETYVIPLEDARMMKAYGVHTSLNKLLIVKGESRSQKRQIHLVLVEEALGF